MAGKPVVDPFCNEVRRRAFLEWYEREIVQSHRTNRELLDEKIKATSDMTHKWRTKLRPIPMQVCANLWKDSGDRRFLATAKEKEYWARHVRKIPVPSPDEWPDLPEHESAQFIAELGEWSPRTTEPEPESQPQPRALKTEKKSSPTAQTQDGGMSHPFEVTLHIPFVFPLAELINAIAERLLLIKREVLSSEYENAINQLITTLIPLSVHTNLPLVIQTIADEIERLACLREMDPEREQARRTLVNPVTRLHNTMQALDLQYPSDHRALVRQLGLVDQMFSDQSGSKRRGS